ncbi:MAG: methyltransferase domain-containing protein [Coriobacteriales bacterium]|jgi:arsenite methyltransferase
MGMRIHHRNLVGVRFQARCDLYLPDQGRLTGRRVLDLCCRNGKGVFAIADRVGPGGSVVGVDPDPTRIAAAREASSRARRERWPQDVTFACADPSDLARAGLSDGGFDLVVSNAALLLAPDVPAALREAARVLAPGGSLYCDVVLEDASDGGAPVRGAWGAGDVRADRGARDDYADGNVFLAAPTRDALEAWLREAGFVAADVSAMGPAAPDGPDASPELRGRAFTHAIVDARTRP